MAEPVVLVPSLGRGASDFDDLVGRLESAGHRAVALDPPVSMPADATLHDYADRVVLDLDRLGFDRVHLIGHAFGQRVARCVVADHPHRVRSLTMLAAGGLMPVPTGIATSLAACFDLSLPETERLEHVRAAFFAPGNDPTVWCAGWLPEVAAQQSAAVLRTDPADWSAAAAPRVLVVQGLDDACAVPENGRRYVAAHPDIAELVEIARAGHALLPEQPDEVAAAVVAFLAAVDP